MEKFQDVVESTIRLKEAKDPKSLGTLEFPWGRSDEENKNGRTYPHGVLAPAVAALGKRIESAKVAGQSDHPLGGGGTRLSDVSHVLDAVWMDGKTAMARASILDTQKGRDALTVINSDVKIGASLRGFGEVKNGKVQPGLEVRGIDLVMNPSFPTASIDKASVIESYMPGEEGISAEDQAKIGKALSGLKEEVLEDVNKMLAKDGADYSAEELKAFPLYLKEKESNRNLPTFKIWFRQMQELFNPGMEIELTEEEERERGHMREAVESGYRGRRADLKGLSRDAFDELVEEGKLDAHPEQKFNYKRFYAEACEAGFTGSFRHWLLEFKIK